MLDVVVGVQGEDEAESCVALRDLVLVEPDLCEPTLRFIALESLAASGMVGQYCRSDALRRCRARNWLMVCDLRRD